MHLIYFYEMSNFKQSNISASVTGADPLFSAQNSSLTSPKLTSKSVSFRKL